MPKRRAPGTVLAKAPHHRGTFHVEGRKVRAAANADPTSRCWRCRLTLAQARARWGAHVHWQAGHLRTGQAGGALRAECSHCNASHGATHGNRQRGKARRTPRLDPLNRSRRW